MAKQKEQTANPEEKEAAGPKEAPPGLLARSAFIDQTRPEQISCYGFRGGIITFVDSDGKVYVTPGTRLKLELLQESGFSNPRPQIEVPYSDGTIKSLRWLRKTLPKGEITRSLSENQMLKPDAQVYVGMLKVNRDGLMPLEDEFLQKRCARVEEKFYCHVGLCASFRGILSFTDRETNTWVTPYSDHKKSLLESHGYVYVESMIKVPYSIDSAENRKWLATHIPLEEWSRTEEEIEESNIEKKLSQAKLRIKKLGLKDLPQDLFDCSALCAETLPGYAGMAGSHNGILSFTDPLGKTYVTPATREKVELLKSLGYQFMGSTIKVPLSLKTEEDILWLQKNIKPEYWIAAQESNEADLKREEREQAEKRQRSLGLKELPAEILQSLIKTDLKQPHFAGLYYERNDILAFVDHQGDTFITPVTKKKRNLLKEAGYQKAAAGILVPYSDGTPSDMEFIRLHLSQEEIDLSRKEREEDTENARRKTIERILSHMKLKEVPEELMTRSAKTEFQEIELIGRFCSRGGVSCFIYKDGVFYVTPTVPWKEKVLAEAGYRPPERLIKVPYGSGTREDVLWLKNNLPPGELEKSLKELRAIEEENRQRELKARQDRLGIGDKIPEELARRSAATPEINQEQIGRYIIQNEWLGFVGPDGTVWITPNTPRKVDLLQKNKYEYASRRFPLPLSSDSNEDETWREANLPKGELLRSREELEELKLKKEEILTSEIIQKRSIQKLPPDFLERCLKIEKVSAKMVGCYLHRDKMIYLADTERNYCITPSTPAKLKVLTDAGFILQDHFPKLPHISGTEEDLAWIKRNLPQGELARSTKELDTEERIKTEEVMKKNISRFSLKPVPDKIIERSADSGTRDPKNIGRLGIYRGVLAFVSPDERVYVTWYTGDKQESLEDCGYRLEGRLPIKVPYAMPDPEQRKWLMEKLPAPDDDESISVNENK